MQAPSVTYRILRGESEWPLLAEFFSRVGIRRDIIPLSNFSRAIVAEYEGQIVACLFMQCAIHFEPLVVDRAHGGRVYMPSLVAKAEEALATSIFKGMPWFAFVDTAHVERIATLCGMEKLTGVSVMAKSAAEAFATGDKMNAEYARFVEQAQEVV
jgi:hypothetical protein